MIKFSKIFLPIVLVALVLSQNSMLGQGHDLEALKKEYPLLMERYGNRLESRRAHYIFAIDISSSMQEYENVVRQSLATFVKAVPDGDQITLIAMCDENNTNYVNSIKCITINSKVRQSIVSSITSPQFKFLRRGDSNDGSDGFTMTRKVLEAMNVVNSSDLTFVYLLTDFEYWTHQNKFNKAAEDWKSLKPLLTEKHTGMMCKYGIELNYNGISHPEAIFKPELDDIFGPLDYQQANSAEILAQWFGHIINDIRAHKINAMLKADWKEYLDSVKISLQKDGRNLNAIIKAPQSDLVSGSSVTMLQGGGEYLIPAKDVIAKKGKDNLWHAEVGHYKTKKTWYPSYFKTDSSDATVVVSFNSPYAEEISKLQGLCQEKAESPNAVKLNQEYVATTPVVKVWNSIIPLWVCVLVLAIIALWLLCLLITFLINKYGKIYRTWNIMVTVDDGENQEFFSHSFPKSRIVTVTPSALGIVNGGNWKFYIITNDKMICWLWSPRGYYIQRGCAMNITRKGKTKALPRKPYRVTPLKKWGSGCILTFESNGVEYSVKIQ